MADSSKDESSDAEFETNPSDSPNSSDAIVPSSFGGPALCLFRFAGDSAAGAFMGSIFGYGLFLSLCVKNVSFVFRFTCLIAGLVFEIGISYENKRVSNH